MTDFMPALTEEEKQEMIIPFRSLLRIVEGIDGNVEMEVGLFSSPE
ncbi:MAG: hypothetical protein MPW15_22390 [Candidatus Manganitrophus sp.]|nr:hypothetical protein [Candidatus Manganitrophus sp.]